MMSEKRAFCLQRKGNETRTFLFARRKKKPTFEITLLNYDSFLRNVKTTLGNFLIQWFTDTAKEKKFRKKKRSMTVKNKYFDTGKDTCKEDKESACGEQALLCWPNEASEVV